MTAARGGPALYLVDAFAERAFAGNPAAVCLLNEWPDGRWLSAVAAEMNQSETAFLVPQGDRFDLRWFTPKVEVDLCGHATLASAFVLWHAGLASESKPIRFSTRSGILSASRNGALIELDFPLEPQTECAPPEGLLSALGVSANHIGQSRFDYFVEVASEQILRGMSPDFCRLAAISCRGVIVTARSEGPAYDFVSRFFAPASGIDEDPVTGSAHCTLAHFWQARLSKNAFKAFQASPRGGVVHVCVRGDRVLLGGSAVLVASGELAVRPGA
jgi:PhzF family phenazine biosynthesis protein